MHEISIFHIQPEQDGFTYSNLDKFGWALWTAHAVWLHKSPIGLSCEHWHCYSSRADVPLSNYSLTRSNSLDVRASSRDDSQPQHHNHYGAK